MTGGTGYDPRITTTRLTLCVVACLAIGSALRFYDLEGHSLWVDEGIQYAAASADSLKDVIQRAKHVSLHPPLSFLINHLFLRLHDSDFMLRLPSVLFGIGTFPLVYMLAKKLTSQTAALCALLVFAISPLHVWYSQEARMYAPWLFVSLLHTLIWLRAIERGHWLWWVLYVGVLVVGVFLHIFMIFNPLFHALWMLFFHRRALLGFVACGCVAALLAFPLTLHWAQVFWRLLFNAQSSRHAQQIATGARVGFVWEAIPYTFYSYGVGFSLGPTIAGLHADLSWNYLVQFFPSILSVGLLFGTLLIIGVCSLLKHGNRDTFWLSLLGLVTPIAAAALLTSLAAFSYNVRYTIMAYPYFCIVLGTGCVTLTRWHTVIGALAILALVSFSTLSLVNYYSQPDYAKEDIRAAVNFWRSEASNRYLLSCCSGSHRVVNRYLSPTEQQHYIYLGGDSALSRAQAFFDTHHVQSAYIFFARDWQRRQENAIRSHFELYPIQSFPGVRLMQIFRK